MAKKKKNIDSVESKQENKLYYFSANFRDGDCMYVTWQGYELTQEQISLYSKVVSICSCPPEVAKKGPCNCGK